MEKCPRCRAESHRYTFTCRPVVTCIAVICDECGYTGQEVPMSHRQDSRAAYAAADAWNVAAKAAARVKRRSLH